MSQNNPPILDVGRDVAKSSLQLDLAGKSHALTNDPKGHARLLKLLRPHPGAQVVCEAIRHVRRSGFHRGFNQK